MQQFIQPAADPSLPDPGKSGESGRNTNPGGVISSVRSLASFIRNPALQAVDSSVHSSTYIPSPAIHNRSLDSDALLGLRTARLRTPVAVFNTHGASGHGSYDSPLMKKALVQAIASQQGLLEISHPGVQPLLQAMQNAITSGRACLPLQLSPCRFIHSIEWVGQQDGVKQWQLHVGSSSVQQVGSTRHVIPLTEVFLPYWPDQAGARNFYGCVNKAQAALEIHLQRVSAAPRGDVVQPVLLSHRSDAIPMVLSMLNQLIASIRAGELEEGAQLAESAELVRAQLDGQLDRPALSDEGFRTALELAQTRLFSNPPVSLHLPSLACQTATLPAPTAYRQPNGDMHCGVTALNAYFQRPILSCGDAIHHLVNSYDEVYGIRGRGLDGLFSHRLLNGVERNQNTWISKQEFLGTGPPMPLHALEGICRDLSPRDQWNTLLNFSFPDAMANASRQGREQREAIDRLHITPGLWLTAFSGLNLDQLVGLANSILVHNHDMPEMASYPDRVEAYTLVSEKPEIRLGHAQAIHADEVEKILGQFRHSDSHGRQSPLPIICMSGAGGSNSVNHYFGILRDAHDRWINLGSDGTRITGQQACSVFAEPGGLAQALVKARVFKIVCPCLAGPHHNFHSLEKSDAHH